MVREASKRNTVRNALVAKEAMAVPTHPRVGNLVDGNAASSTTLMGELQIQETVPTRGTWGNREAVERINSVNDEFHRYRTEWKKGEWLAEPDGTPRANALRRTARTCRGADLACGRLINPSITCPCPPEFGIDAEDVELEQGGMQTVKLAAESSACKGREEARNPFRLQARNAEIEATSDGFGREYLEERHARRRKLAQIRRDMRRGFRVGSRRYRINL